MTKPPFSPALRFREIIREIIECNAASFNPIPTQAGNAIAFLKVRRRRDADQRVSRFIAAKGAVCLLTPGL
jgi:hypothetical protein